MSYSTKTVADTRSFNKIYYCVYCGELAKYEYEYDHRDKYEYRWCTCKYATAEHELELMIYNAPKPNAEIVNKIEHRNEVHKLNCKYGIHK